MLRWGLLLLAYVCVEFGVNKNENKISFDIAHNYNYRCQEISTKAYKHISIHMKLRYDLYVRPSIKKPQTTSYHRSQTGSQPYSQSVGQSIILTNKTMRHNQNKCKYPRIYIIFRFFPLSLSRSLFMHPRRSERCTASQKWKKHIQITVIPMCRCQQLSDVTKLSGAAHLWCCGEMTVRQRFATR